MLGLTPRQRQLMIFIRNAYQDSGAEACGPTVAEMCTHMAYNSHGALLAMISKLEGRKLVERQVRKRPTRWKPTHAGLFV